MGEYLTTENLAIYAAITSTIGIIFTGLQYWLNVKDKKVNLKIVCSKYPDYEKELNKINALKPHEGGVTRIKFYIISIKNIGNVKAFIEDAYVLSAEGLEYKVNVTILYGAGLNFYTIPDYEEDICIEPKSSKDFYVYLDKDEKIFEVKSCCVLTKTGEKINCVKPIV